MNYKKLAVRLAVSALVIMAVYFVVATLISASKMM